MIPLVVRSHYSLMWGTTSIKQLCRTAKEMGYTHLALTDTDNLYGLWPFLTECRRQEIRPIIGAEVTDPKHDSRAVCLAKTPVGYSNLCQLLTNRHMNKNFNLENDLPAYSHDLIVLTTNIVLLSAWHEAGVQVVAAMPGRTYPASHPLYQRADELALPIVAVPDSYFLFPAVIDDFSGNLCTLHLGLADFNIFFIPDKKNAVKGD